MSKNISITEGGTGRGFTARRLETALEEGGSCLWVPKDEVRRVTKSVDENGTYEATAEGAYGYSEVHVNVKGGGSATGKGPDGNEYTVTVNDLGDLTETKVPSSIKITTPPTFVGPYGDGAIIGFDGIEVTAYDAEGNSMGAVPFEELVFPVTIARYDPDAGEAAETATSELDVTPLPKPFAFGRGSEYGMGEIDNILSQTCALTSGDTVVEEHDDFRRYGFIIVAASATPFMATSASGRTYNSKSYTVNEKTVYYTTEYGTTTYYPLYPKKYNTLPEGLPGSISEQQLGNIAWTMIYGDITETGGVPIPVQWPRPGDGRILADTFAIEVVDATQDANA